MKGQQQQPQHVVLFPFMGHGHFTPFIALADLLQRRQPELTITIINTPLNIQTIQSSLPPNSTIRLRSIPFTPFDHGLPPAAESMADIPRHHFHTFFLAVESLKPHFEQLLHQIIEEDGHLPFIISDIFLAWTVEIAHKLGIFHSILFTGGAYGFSMLFSLTVNFPPSILPITGTEFSSPDFPHVHIHCTQLPRSVLVGNVPHLFFRRLLSYCSQSDAVLVNTVKEFETTGLCMLEKLTGVHALPVGPLFIKPSSSFSSLHSDARCIEWLDSHPPGSVLYVSFGSQNSINGSQMMELAAGLEASGKPFIWAIRPPYGADNMAEEYFKQEWLPEGFEERMRLMKRGLLVHGWAPQVEILAHGSTAAILSHCGWNAVQESLSYGVPIIGWPIGADQIYNSKFLEEEVGVCVELGRGNMESMSVVVERERVKNVVEMVMGGKEKGGELKKKAMEIRMMMRGALLEGGNGDKGSSIQILEEFLNAARSYILN